MPLFLIQAWGWLSAHQIVLWMLVWSLVLPVFRTRTPAQWVALADAHPRVHAIIKLARAVGFDPVKALSALAQLVTGRVRAAGLPVSDDAPAAPRGQSGFVAVRPLVWLALVGAGALVVLPIVAALTLPGCSGSQHPHTVSQDVRAALATAAHGVDAADAVIAQRYAQEASDAAVLSLLEHRYADAVSARRFARDALLAAQSTVEAVDLGTATPCAERAAVAEARRAIGALLDAMDVIHVPAPPEIAEGANALVAINQTLAPACVDDGGTDAR